MNWSHSFKLRSHHLLVSHYGLSHLHEPMTSTQSIYETCKKKKKLWYQLGVHNRIRNRLKPDQIDQFWAIFMGIGPIIGTGEYWSGSRFRVWNHPLGPDRYMCVCFIFMSKTSKTIIWQSRSVSDTHRHLILFSSLSRFLSSLNCLALSVWRLALYRSLLPWSCDEGVHFHIFVRIWRINITK